MSQAFQAYRNRILIICYTPFLPIQTATQWFRMEIERVLANEKHVSEFEGRERERERERKGFSRLAASRLALHAALSFACS